MGDSCASPLEHVEGRQAARGTDLLPGISHSLAFIAAMETCLESGTGSGAPVHVAATDVGIVATLYYLPHAHDHSRLAQDPLRQAHDPLRQAQDRLRCAQDRLRCAHSRSRNGARAALGVGC